MHDALLEHHVKKPWQEEAPQCWFGYMEVDIRLVIKLHLGTLPDWSQKVWRIPMRGYFCCNELSAASLCKLSGTFLAAHTHLFRAGCQDPTT